MVRIAAIYFIECFLLFFVLYLIEPVTGRLFIEIEIFVVLHAVEVLWIQARLQRCRLTIIGNLFELHVKQPIVRLELA